MRGTFRIVSVNLSGRTGERKRSAGRAKAVAGHGLEGDAHAGPGERQVSLLAIEDIEAMRSRIPSIGPGDFAENLTTEGVDLASLPVGTRLSIGDALLEITRIGKECRAGCAIREQAGDCVMPRRGVFARVVRGGVISDESAGSYDI
jgi:MOSC domain-containing protein YiiM